MNVLSLFDGMSCGRVALERAGITVDKYYAAEIDKYAIQIAKKNYPETIHLGDVTNVKGCDFPKIDLLLGGSPCQGFSFAGKQLAFDDPRSRLFFEYVRILKEVKPKYFLLENVRMKKEHQDIISKYLEVEPIAINSSLVSGQNRYRLYWTNIPNVKQPMDKKIYLRDILFDESNWFYQKPRGKNSGGLELGKSGSLTSSAWEQNNFPVNLSDLVLSQKAIKYMNRTVKGGRNHWDFAHHSDIKNDKSSTIVANFFKGVPYNVLRDWGCTRKFHPIECERLQTLPDNYTEGVSNTQRYKMIGNGWTVDVISHILKNLTNQGNQ